MSDDGYKYKINLDTITADRLNEDVIVLWGCTFNEIIRNLIFSYVASSLLVIPIFIFFGKVYFGMICDLFLGGLILLAVSRWMGNLKEGKPRKYYEHLVALWMMKIGLKKKDRIITSQKWSVRRVANSNKN